MTHIKMIAASAGVLLVTVYLIVALPVAESLWTRWL